MRRIFKTTATFIALFLAFFVFSQTVSAAGGVLSASKTNVATDEGYTITVRTSSGGPGNVIVYLRENGEVASPYTKNCRITGRSGGECSVSWDISAKGSPGSFTYVAVVSPSWEGRMFDTTPLSVTVKVGSVAPPPTPAALPACSFNNCSNLQTNCKCGATDIRQPNQAYCFSGTAYFMSEDIEDDAQNQRQLEECKAAGGGGTGQTPPPGQGQGPIPLPDLGAIKIENPIEAENFQQLLDAIVNFILWVGLAVAPVVIIIAGFFYITSAGSPQRIETAKTMITYSLVGVAVLLLATGLVQVLKSILGVK